MLRGQAKVLVSVIGCGYLSSTLLAALELYSIFNIYYLKIPLTILH